MAPSYRSPGPKRSLTCVSRNLVLLGSTAVGKSSLAYRYVKNDFQESLPTVGCSFFTKIIRMESATVKLEIWDTAGQEKYHSVCHLYYRGAHAALLVYDITNKETLGRAKLWLRELEKEFLHDEIVIALVGNKTDLAEEREVPAEEGEEFARSRSLLFTETSAKSNHQVKDVFMAVAERQEERRRAFIGVPHLQLRCCAPPGGAGGAEGRRLAASRPPSAGCLLPRLAVAQISPPA
uniref:RAB17, member RAS oncogene family n=1 Tax=Anser brachyrhynchus TaxID=132585 RepID=A0A8B9D032_9AVES